MFKKKQYSIKCDTNAYSINAEDTNNYSIKNEEYTPKEDYKDNSQETIDKLRSEYPEDSTLERRLEKEEQSFFNDSTSGSSQTLKLTVSIGLLALTVGIIAGVTPALINGFKENLSEKPGIVETIPNNEYSVTAVADTITNFGYNPQVEFYCEEYDETVQILLSSSDIKYIVLGESYPFERYIKQDYDGNDVASYKILIDYNDTSNIIESSVSESTEKKIIGGSEFYSTVYYKYTNDINYTDRTVKRSVVSGQSHYYYSGSSVNYGYFVLYNIEVDGKTKNIIQNITSELYDNIKIGEQCLVKQELIEVDGEQYYEYSLVTK